MMVPHKVALHLDKFYVHIVDRTRYTRRPVLLELLEAARYVAGTYSGWECGGGDGAKTPSACGKQFPLVHS